MTRTLTPLVLTALLVGCDADPDDSGAANDTGRSWAATTLQALNGGEHDAGSDVSLSGVVVTTTPSDELAAFFVQDEQGGEFSGMRVVLMDGVDLPEVVQGDVVEVRATYAEQDDGPRLVLESLDHLEVTGSAELSAEAVDVPNDWTPWQGVLVELSGPVVDGCPAG